MEEDLILGDDEEEVVDEDFGYSYTEYISASVEVLTFLESANPMTKTEVKRVENLRKLCFEMLEHSVKELHNSLFNV